MDNVKTLTLSSLVSIYEYEVCFVIQNANTRKWILGCAHPHTCHLVYAVNMDSLKVDLEIVTQKRPLPEGDSLVGALGRLDTFAKRTDISEHLRHYLSRRSYLKALAWLENPELPHQQ